MGDGHIKVEKVVLTFGLRVIEVIDADDYSVFSHDWREMLSAVERAVRFLILGGRCNCWRGERADADRLMRTLSRKRLKHRLKRLVTSIYK